MQSPPRLACRSIPLVIIATYLIAAIGCAWWSEHKSDIKAAAISCAKYEVAADLEPALLTMLFGQAPSMEDQMIALGEKFGEGALACGVQRALTALEVEKRVSGQLSIAGAQDLGINRGITSAQAMIQKHGWRFSP